MKIRYIEVSNFRGIKSLSTKIDGNFICLIGPGDSCKSTVISAIDYALTPRWNIIFDDSDFFNQNIESPISISITLGEWDQANPEIKDFFSESKFGQFIGGLGQNGPTPEPDEDGPKSITINLQVDKSLEPKWSVVKGEDSKPIGAGDRKVFGVGRIDTFLDNNFTWSRNSLLSRLSSTNEDNLDTVLTEIARTARDTPFSLSGCDKIASEIEADALKIGVLKSNLNPKIDIQKLSVVSGALSLHSDNIPLRNLGYGSKKLTCCAMQMKLRGGEGISLIDEIELGLEPHRIRGLLSNFKKSNQQVLTTTHSPVVLRELEVSELYVCRCCSDGLLELRSISEIPGAQAAVRSNAEAFLSRKIVVCEGKTEIGCLRALDTIRSQGGSVPVWTLSTSYFNAGGIDQIKRSATTLKDLGYNVAILCDNDEPKKFSDSDVEDLKKLGIQVYIWNPGKSIEEQLFSDIGFEYVEGLLDLISEIHDSKDKQALIQSVKAKKSDLPDNYTDWIDVPGLRLALGQVAKGKESKSNSGWFKRIDYAEKVFLYSLPLLASTSVMLTKLTELWDWIQCE